MVNWKNLWLVAGLGLFLGACQPAAAPTPIPTNNSPVVVEGSSVSAVQIFVAGDDFEIGTPRVPLVFFDGPNHSSQVQAVHITALDLSQAQPTAVWEGEAVGYDDYEVPYWVFYPEISKAGVWGMKALVTLKDGSVANLSFAFQVEEKTNAPLIGQPAIASQNRTLASEPDLKKLSSDPNPDPALYQITVAEALESGRPVVVTFNTPAFCQTSLCAPVIETAKSLQKKFGEQIYVIHLEIYKEFNPLVVADEVGEWNLPSEPWTFVINPAGEIIGRFSGPVSPQELEPVLAELGVQ